MVDLTKEQICNKISNLRYELGVYRAMLDQINAQEESEFSRKVKSMVGGYYMKDLEDYRWYCRIDRVDKVQDSNIDGLYAKCECAIVTLPKDTSYGYSAVMDYIYADEYDIVDYKPITEGEFEAAFAQFNNAFKKI